MSKAPFLKKSREDYRREKELEEARKAGNAPAEVDEDGKDINPHIPQYISQAPWYYATDGPTLKHQRVPEEFKEKQEHAGINEYYKRGLKKPAATRFRKGACSNCGAMSHKRAECMERPRRVGAKFTNKDIAPDEVLLPDIKLDFEGKRDRWNGYDVNEYSRVVSEYQKIEDEKRKLKTAQAATVDTSEIKNDDDSSDSDDDEDDKEEKYAESAAQPGTKFDAKARFTVRNLRIREDTAKYLRNLDINSAHYDPKTRSMRANPYQNTAADPDRVTYVGDNFVRYSGEVGTIAEKQMFAWNAGDKGSDVHMQADPTKLELMHKQFEVKRETFKDGQQKSVLEKYGGEEHLKAPPKELLLAQTEGYVEYSQTGRVLKGQEEAKVTSKYEEDKFPGNHKAVWGSYWEAGKWGYDCCYSLERGSYCAGQKGREARQAQKESLLMVGETEEKEPEQQKSLMQLHQEKQLEDTSEKKRKKKEKKSKKKKRRKGEKVDDEEEDEEAIRERKIQEFMTKHEQEAKRMDEMMKLDERDRKYNSSAGGDHLDITEEEMEAYRRKRVLQDDPMKNFM